MVYSTVCECKTLDLRLLDRLLTLELQNELRHDLAVGVNG